MEAVDSVPLHVTAHSNFVFYTNCLLSIKNFVCFPKSVFYTL